MAEHSRIELLELERVRFLAGGHAVTFTQALAVFEASRGKVISADEDSRM